MREAGRGRGGAAGPGGACVSIAVLVATVASIGCRHPAQPPAVGRPVPRSFDEIEVCGRRFHTGTRVVLFHDPGGYDAYRCGPFFGGEGKEGPRYSLRSAGVDPDVAARARERGYTLDELRGVVVDDELVDDAAGSARRCFRILHDERGLSVHFLLDTDGTIYQTLDLREKAWHATRANSRSIGIEIAQIGAYPERSAAVFERWYGRDEEGPYLKGPGGTVERTSSGAERLRPARPDLVRGRIQGEELLQYDFTDAQYEALAHLLAALARIFPRLRLEAPRDAEGRVLTRALSDEEFASFRGVLGHYHVQPNKVDPGPAFDWERVLRRARLLAGRCDGEPGGAVRSAPRPAPLERGLGAHRACGGQRALRSPGRGRWYVRAP